MGRIEDLIGCGEKGKTGESPYQRVVVDGEGRANAEVVIKVKKAVCSAVYCEAETEIVFGTWIKNPDCGEPLPARFSRYTGDADQEAVRAFVAKWLKLDGDNRMELSVQGQITNGKQQCGRVLGLTPTTKFGDENSKWRVYLVDETVRKGKQSLAGRSAVLITSKKPREYEDWLAKQDRLSKG